jgi:hypothetical protein
MKIKDNQELVIIMPAKDRFWHISAKEIRSWPSPDVVHDSIKDALCRLEKLLDIGCYSTYISVQNGTHVGQIDGKPAMMVLAMPEDPLVKKLEEAELEIS